MGDGRDRYAAELTDKVDTQWQGSFLPNTYDTKSRFPQAGSLIAIVPIIVVFLLLQRYYIRGLTAGAVRG